MKDYDLKANALMRQEALKAEHREKVGTRGVAVEINSQMGPLDLENAYKAYHSGANMRDTMQSMGNQAGVYIKDEPSLMREAHGHCYSANFDAVYAAVDRRLTVGDNVQLAPYQVGSVDYQVVKIAQDLVKK